MDRSRHRVDSRERERDPKQRASRVLARQAGERVAREKAEWEIMAAAAFQIPDRARVRSLRPTGPIRAQRRVRSGASVVTTHPGAASAMNRIGAATRLLAEMGFTRSALRMVRRETKPRAAEVLIRAVNVVEAAATGTAQRRVRQSHAARLPPHASHIPDLADRIPRALAADRLRNRREHKHRAVNLRAEATAAAIRVRSSICGSQSRVRPTDRRAAMADTAAIVLQATAAVTAAGMSVHPAVDTLTAAEDIRPEEGAGILVEATRGAAIARFFRSSFSRQVFHDLQLLECCRFDGVSELK